MSAQFSTGNHDKKSVARNAWVIASRGPGIVLPALAALGIGGPASALELGPAKVQSTLGQPLRASIAFALGRFEEISPYCIRISPRRSQSGLPPAGPASVRIDDGVILVTGEGPVSDPLLGLQLMVDCPNAPHLSREYVVFVDPGRPVATDPLQTAERSPAIRRPSTAAAVPAAEPAIPAGATYRVQRGDTLSNIAERLSGRRLGLWQAAQLLFAANGHAFIDSDPDLLRAGALLRIPKALYNGASPAVADRAQSERPDQASPAPATTPYAGYVPDRAAAGESADSASVPPGLFRNGMGEATVAPPAAPTAPPMPAPARETRLGTPVETHQASPQPGDVRVDAGGLFVSPIEVEKSGIDTYASPFIAPATPATDTPEPTVLPAASEREEPAGGWSWLLWLGGSGVALILGLLLFGRTLKGRAGSGRTLALRETLAWRRDEDALAEDAELEGDETNVDLRFDEIGEEARIVRVDVDLEDGTGFQETGDIHVAQDFGFSASGGLELGLTVDFSEESPAKLDAAGRQREGDVIVEREIPPGDPATSEYDVSMILDATRQPLDDTDDTEKDLHAIELENDETSPEEDPFTLSREVDYKILEQDYEEELTATQALAAELSNAARDLVERLYDEPGDVHELPTVEMPAPGSEPTAEMPRADSAPAGEPGTLEMLPEPETAEGADPGARKLAILPDAENDASAEMEIESAIVDTKKLKAS